MQVVVSIFLVFFPSSSSSHPFLPINEEKEKREVGGSFSLIFISPFSSISLGQQREIALCFCFYWKERRETPDFYFLSFSSSYSLCQSLPERASHVYDQPELPLLEHRAKNQKAKKKQQQLMAISVDNVIKRL
jgi:hypothetical protein